MNRRRATLSIANPWGLAQSGVAECATTVLMCALICTDQPLTPPHDTIYLQAYTAATYYIPTVSWHFGTNAKLYGQPVPLSPVVVGGSSFFPSQNGELEVYPVGSQIDGKDVNPPGFEANFLVIKNTAGPYTAKVCDLLVSSFKFTYLSPQNGVSLTFANGATTSFAAQDLLGGASVTGQQSYRVSFDMGGRAAISTVVFYNNKSNQSGDRQQSESGGNGTSLFYTDSITGAAPESATSSMMILGFGLVGAPLRSGRHSRLPAAT